ncbi:serine/threonine-protein kinase-like protein CCR4 [Curcuma longa]|uniref:serine/threonine-protein kinase-like protein CCR4 n=1 Tax=Curcuma longa TaxID=136217 RepID=UPI003D9E75DA
MPPPPPNPAYFFFLLTLLLCSSSAIASPFSTLAVSQPAPNITLVCALVPSELNLRYDLNCTSASTGHQVRYLAGATPYGAVAAGNGFLCGLTLPYDNSNATMRWWTFPDHGNDTYEKRIYRGPPLAALASGDTHVCGLKGGWPQCWRWKEIRFPPGIEFSDIAVGRNFVCGRLKSGTIGCYGSDMEVTDNVPDGNFSLLAAGTWHACAKSYAGRLTCWGSGKPVRDSDQPDIVSIALGENKTCVLRSNGTVLCWGEGSRPPESLAGEQFLRIQARGDAICGILSVNFSVVCWGNKLFLQRHTVYKSVLPGACSPASSCVGCVVLPGSGNMCPSGEVICQSCQSQLDSNSTTSLPPPQQSGSGRKRKTLFVVLGSVGFSLGLLALLGFLVFRALRKRSNGGVQGSVSLDSSLDGRLGGGTVEEFSLQLVMEITDNFSETHKIGSGSFGAVYRATLPDGREAAIKRANPASATPSTSRRHEQLRRLDQEQRERAFCSELALLSRINHKNLVRLLGFCRERGERVLVYEYMTHGTLHDNLHRRPMVPSSPLSSWTTRLRLALDAARGIEYLHAYAVPPIIHRDIKSSNILLDEEWMAKVADFGLSLTSPEDEGSVAAGTVGYMDPEYYRLRRLTEKSDVYSFGVVLLELITGYKAIHRSMEVEDGEAEGSTTPRNVVEMAVPYIETDEVARIMDRRVAPASPEEIEAVAYVGYVAAECVAAEGQDRPTMGEVVGALERAYAACSVATAARTESTAGRRVLSRAPSFL